MRLGINGRFYAAPLTGVQRFAREVGARLCERADDAVLFLPARARTPSGIAQPARSVGGLLAGHAWEQLELPARARGAGCDVVLHLANAAPVLGRPNVVVVHDVLALTHPEWFTPRFARWYRVAQGLSARRAAAVVTVSEWARGEISRVLGIHTDGIRVVSQGVEPFDRPASPEAVRRVRSRWALPDPYLLTVAGQDPRKNVRFLLDMLARWRERYGSAPSLVVVGGVLPRVHPAAARGVATADRPGGHPCDVRLLGRVTDEELRALYTGAAAFCFPSLAEGFGRPPLEAMGCGAPAVVAPYGPARAVVGDAARIVPLDADAWIAATLPLVAAGVERERIVARGRRHALRYSWDGAAGELLEICRAVSAARSPRPAARAGMVAGAEER